MRTTPARLIALAWSCALLLAGAACANPSAGDAPRGDSNADLSTDARSAVPATAPDIRGTITWLQDGDSVARAGSTGNPDATVSCPPDCGPSGAPMRAVLIEDTPGGLSSGGDKSRVSVPSTARVLRRAGTDVTNAGFGALRVGQRVDAWFTGPVAESYPTQSTARIIVVTGP